MKDRIPRSLTLVTSYPKTEQALRLLSPIILILLGAVDRLGNQFSVSNTIASQFMRHDLCGLPTMRPDQALEETLSSSPISFGLKIDVDHLAMPTTLLVTP